MFTVDEMFDFFNKYSCLSQAQKEVLNHDFFTGTIDEYSIYLGYGAPASNPFRKDVNRLAELNLISALNLDDKIFGSRKLFIVPPKEVWVKELLKLPQDMFVKKKVGMHKKGNDRRQEANRRRNKSRKKDV